MWGLQRGDESSIHQSASWVGLVYFPQGRCAMRDMLCHKAIDAKGTIMIANDNPTPDTKKPATRDAGAGWIK